MQTNYLHPLTFGMTVSLFVEVSKVISFFDEIRRLIIDIF